MLSMDHLVETRSGYYQWNVERKVFEIEHAHTLYVLENSPIDIAFDYVIIIAI